MADSAPRGLMTFPGIQQIERGTFTHVQGITPSIAVIEIVPQDASTIPLDGDLHILFGDTEIVFSSCRIDQATFQYTQQGFVWRLSILDRRWKWRFAGPYGPVSGWWNQRFDAIQPAPQDWQLNYVQQGSVNPDTLRSPQQLAAMLLDVMGEENYDVSALPDNSLPEAVWDMDNPAQLLQQLCDSLGSRVTLGLDNIVRIAQAGIGADLPSENIEMESDVVDPPEIPESIVVVGGRNRYQVDFLLEAVGLDVTGVIVPINQLSYAPVTVNPGYFPNGKDPDNNGGWGWIFDLDPEYGFQEIPGWEVEDVVPPLTPPKIANAWQMGDFANNVNPRYLARQTVWRWFRIAWSFSADSTLKAPLIPGWGTALGSSPVVPPEPPNGAPARKQADAQKGQKKPPVDPKSQWGTRITNIWQILPIEDKQILGWYDYQNNFHPYDAAVYGFYWSPSWDGFLGAANPTQDASYNFTSPVWVGTNYEIDAEHGIVRFEEPMVGFSGTNQRFIQPRLYLRTTVSPRYFGSGAPDRFFFRRNLTDQGGKAGTGPRVVRREEIVRHVVAVYDESYNVTSTYNNDDAIIEEANYAIDAALLEYQTKQPRDVTYMGIVPIAVDGAITQVLWSVGPGGATTRAARDTEVLFAVPSYRERALIGSLRDTTGAMRDLQTQARKK